MNSTQDKRLAHPRMKRKRIGETEEASVLLMVQIDGEASATSRDSHDENASAQRMIDLFKRERDLAERELAITRRELEIVRGTRTSNDDNTNQLTGMLPPEPFLQNPRKVSVTAIGDLVNFFDGHTEKFETWGKQVLFLKDPYELDESMMKIIIGMRLKGKALEWFYSGPEYIGMTINELLANLRSMFFIRTNKIFLKRRFEERQGKKTEKFCEYVHDKIILANRVTIPEDELLEYIVDGISDQNLQNVARTHRFTTKEDLVMTFGEISLQT